MVKFLRHPWGLRRGKGLAGVTLLLGLLMLACEGEQRPPKEEVARQPGAAADGEKQVEVSDQVMPSGPTDARDDGVVRVGLLAVAGLLVGIGGMLAVLYHKARGRVSQLDCDKRELTQTVERLKRDTEAKEAQIKSFCAVEARLQEDNGLLREALSARTSGKLDPGAYVTLSAFDDRISEIWREIRRLVAIEGRAERIAGEMTTLRERFEAVAIEVGRKQLTEPRDGDRRMVEAQAGEPTLQRLVDLERDHLRAAWDQFREEAQRTQGINIDGWIRDFDERPAFRSVEEVTTSLLEKLPLDDSSLITSVRNSTIAPGLLIKQGRLLFACQKILATSLDDSGGLTRLRKYGHLLAILQYTDASRRLFGFDPREWLRSDFLELADRILRAGAVLDSRASDAPSDLVCRVLRSVNLEPIPVDLRRAHFDGRWHEAASSERDVSLPDGVIVGIVRSGFREIGASEGRVHRRALVVVNRVR